MTVRQDESLRLRFERHVDCRGPDDCWPWTAGRDRDGYGKFKIAKKQNRAHRVAFALATGQQPGELWVLHRCDNPPCVNPAHLFLGTIADNVADMVAKGRNYIPAGPRDVEVAERIAAIITRHPRTSSASLSRRFAIPLRTAHRYAKAAPPSATGASQ